MSKKLLKILSKNVKSKETLLSLVDRIMVLAILIAFGIESKDLVIAYLLLTTIF